MRVICDCSSLQSVFQIAATVAPSRTSKPILSNVRMDVGDSTVLMANSLEIGVRIGLETEEIPYGGSVLLPVDRFGPILRETSDKKIVIESNDGLILVKGDRCRFEIPSASPDEFPMVPPFEYTAFHEVDGPLFRHLIRRTIFATNDDGGARYALAGVHLEFGEDSLFGVSTDGRRLSCMKLAAEAVGGHSSPGYDVVIPSKALAVVERAINEESPSTIRIAIAKNKAHFQVGETTVSASLVEGRFPRWREVLKKRGLNSVQIEAGKLHVAVRQASVMNDKESRGVVLRFTDGMLTLEADTAEKGKSQIQVELAYDGDPTSLTIDHRYIADFLKVLAPEQTVLLRFSNPETMLHFSTDDGSIYAIMPLTKE
jgi:DNA polymerase III subunit beta